MGKSTLAATVAWFVAHQLLGAQSPAFAPFSAALLVQVSVYRSVTRSLQYVLAVVLGVAVQAVLGFLLGPRLWTFALVALAALAIGRWRTLGPQGDQVATAAFFAFSAFTVVTSLDGRIAQLGNVIMLVLAGSAIGVVTNLLVFPPMRLRSAEYGLTTLARATGDLVDDVATRLHEGVPDSETTSYWRYRARLLGGTVEQARSAVRTAEESVWYNPRVMLRRYRNRTSVAGYEAATNALGRVVGQLESVTRALHHGREAATGAETGYVRFLRDYGAFLAAVDEAIEVLASLSQERLRDDIGELDSRVQRAREHADRLATAARGSALGPDEYAQAYGTLLIEASRFLDELSYAHSALSQGWEAQGWEKFR
ncbi:aromatic acid exporter family protein [Salinactinospora qingdaonensis]|uniref:aromatic acid exporter family protein n=1 Tax=Salinactinospora qingdaonensis TaxID=702744 RepID=UPI0031EC2829